MTRPLRFPDRVKDSVTERRLDNLEARSLTRPQTDSSHNVLPATDANSRAFTLTVAAADSSDAEIAGADYVCTGTNDDDTVTAAVDEIAFSSPSGVGAVMLLSGGYDFADKVTVRAGVAVLGQGAGTFVSNFNDNDALFELRSNAEVRWLAIGHNGPKGIDASVGTHHLLAGVRGGTLYLGNGTRVDACFAEVIEFAGQFAVASGCTFHDLLFDSGSDNNEATGCTYGGTADVGRSLLLDGTDNVVTACRFKSRGSADNTDSVVEVSGTRNSFTNNMVRSSSGVLRPKYGVEVLGAATDARVRFNDIRAGDGAWGTAAYADAGTATLASDND